MLLSSARQFLCFLQSLEGRPCIQPALWTPVPRQEASAGLVTPKLLVCTPELGRMVTWWPFSKCLKGGGGALGCQEARGEPPTGREEGPRTWSASQFEFILCQYGCRPLSTSLNLPGCNSISVVVPQGEVSIPSPPHRPRTRLGTRVEAMLSYLPRSD